MTSYLKFVHKPTKIERPREKGYLNYSPLSVDSDEREIFVISNMIKVVFWSIILQKGEWLNDKYIIDNKMYLYLM